MAAQPTLPASLQSQRPERRRDRIENTITVTKLRVGRVLWPLSYDLLRRQGEAITSDSKYRTIEGQFFVFSEDVASLSLPEGSARQAAKVFSGFISALDVFHTYTFVCTEDPIRSAKYKSPSYKIARMLDIQMDPFSGRTLEILARNILQTDQHANVINNNAPASAPPAQLLGAVLRAFGKEEWFAKIEAAVPWAFREWYLHEICPPYEFKSLVSMPIDDLFALMRFVVSEPYKLCFWWMYLLPTAEDVKFDGAKALAAKFCVPQSAHIDELKRAVSVIEAPDGLFSRLRDRGDSYVPVGEFEQDEAAFCSQDLRRNLMWLGLVKYITENGDPSAHVYATSDYVCECKVAEIIQQITARNRDTVEWSNHLDDYMATAAEAAADKENDSAAAVVAPLLTPNAEQQKAIADALAHRLYVVGGIGGSGKSTCVMKHIHRAFKKGTVLGVSFTGIAAIRQHAIVHTGVTVHKVIQVYLQRSQKLQKYQKCSVLMIEEGSFMTLRLLLTLLMLMKNQLSRIYIFGDWRQMPAPGGGASLMQALIQRYVDTPMGSDLTVSMRTTSPALLYNLKQIFKYNDGRSSLLPCPTASKLAHLKLKFSLDWSNSPFSGHSFTFLSRPDTKGVATMSPVAAMVNFIYNMLVVRVGEGSEAKLCTAKCSRFQIMVHTNEYRIEFSRLWHDKVKRSNYDKSAPTSAAAYSENKFEPGDVIMFLENNYGFTLTPSKHKSDKVWNGIIGRILSIYIENPRGVKIADNLASTSDTIWGSSLASSEDTKWISVSVISSLTGGESEILHICIGRVYDLAKITHVPPVTTSKMQCNDCDIAIVIIDRASKTFSRRELYTACSRAKEQCIVISDLDNYDATAESTTRIGDTAAPADYKIHPTRCPSHEFETVVLSYSMMADNTVFYTRFPPCGGDETTAIAQQQQQQQV